MEKEEERIHAPARKGRAGHRRAGLRRGGGAYVVKSYDPEWATARIKPYLAPDGFVVSLQNCINEDMIGYLVA